MGLTVERDIARIEQRVQTQQEFGGHRWPNHGGQSGIGWPHLIGGNAVSAAVTWCPRPRVAAWRLRRRRRRPSASWTSLAATATSRSVGTGSLASPPPPASTWCAPPDDDYPPPTQRYEARSRLCWSPSSDEDPRQIRSNNHRPRLHQPRGRNARNARVRLCVKTTYRRVKNPIHVVRGALKTIQKRP